MLPGLELAWECWNTLHRRRQMGMGVQPIPFTEIESFLRLAGFRPGRTLTAQIVDIDDLWVARMRSPQLKREPPKKPIGQR